MFTTPSDYWHFFWAGLARVKQTGGLVPSQRFLVGKMIQPVPSKYRGSILELGAGTGELTVRLALRCPRARIIACEINPTLARTVKDRLGRAGLRNRVQVIAAAAQDLLSGMDDIEYIISSIPLANLTREDALDLIGGISQSLRPGGWYIQFQHSLLDRKNIKSRFREIHTVPVLLNIPPAVVYFARK